MKISVIAFFLGFAVATVLRAAAEALVPTIWVPMVLDRCINLNGKRVMNEKNEDIDICPAGTTRSVEIGLASTGVLAGWR